MVVLEPGNFKRIIARNTPGDGEAIGQWLTRPSIFRAAALN